MFNAPGCRPRRSRSTDKSGYGERLQGRRRSTISNQFGQNLANRRTELEAMPGKTERVNEVRRSGREADHRDEVRHLTIDAAPAADDVRALQHGNQVERLRHPQERLVSGASRYG